MIHPISIALCILAALTSWRWSRLVAAALALGAAANVVYEFAAWESLRGISAVTGLLGLVELSDRAGRRYAERRRMLVSWAHPAPIGRPDALAALLVWSSLVDGLALLWWRKTAQWGALPFFQVVVLVVMIVVGLWPRRRRA